MENNELINRGSTVINGKKYHGLRGEDEKDWMRDAQGRCKMQTADAAIEFIAFALCAGCAALSFLALKKGHPNKGQLV